MNYKKILGLFKAVPFESWTTKDLHNFTQIDIKEVQDILNKLVKEGKIKGKRKYSLPKEYKDKIRATLPK